MNRSILLVDDDLDVLALLGRFFEGRGWQVQRSTDAPGALADYQRERPDLVLLDIGLPGMSGLELLKLLRLRDPDATVIMLTGAADVPTAVEAMRSGAENFITKPAELSHLEAAVERACEKAELRRRNRFFAARQAAGTDTSALGSSPLMRDIARQVELLAASDQMVLITGETGTGKGWVAHLLHSLSGRRHGPLAEINCAGLPASFLEAEVFGQDSGPGPDAGNRRRGLVEICHQGTLFLDEVGEMAPELQPRLLELLQTERFRPRGGARQLESSTRLLAATNRDLQQEVRAGRFREDLFYRLAALPLRLPPLRERGPDDVAELAHRLLAELRRRFGRGPSDFTSEALALLTGYAWPGNIREMRNVLERIVLITDVPAIQPTHLPPEILAADRCGGPGDTLLSLAALERCHIARVLAHHGGNRTSAARTLGIARATLYEKLRRYGLDQVGRIAQ